MHIDLQLIQCLFEVAAVGAKTGKHNSAHGVENNFIGVGGKEILGLGKVIANGNNPFAAFLETLQGAADLFQLGDAATGQIVGIQKNMGNALSYWAWSRASTISRTRVSAARWSVWEKPG